VSCMCWSKATNWAHVEALDPDAGYWGPPVCATRQLAGAGRESRDRAVVPSAAELVDSSRKSRG
jgi:hypothetical protein